MLEQLGDAATHVHRRPIRPSTGLPAQGRDTTSLRTTHYRIFGRRHGLSEQEGANGLWSVEECHHLTSR